MNCTKIPLTGTNRCISLTNAACPMIAQRLTSYDPNEGAKLNHLGPDLTTKFKLKNCGVNEINQWFGPLIACSHKYGFRRQQTIQPKHSRFLNSKTFNSDFLSRSPLALKQVVFTKHALRNRHMHNPNTDQQITTINLVTVDKCAELVGWTKDAINALRVKGKIRINIHWIKRNGRIFIDMAAFQHWIRTGV